MAQLELLGSGYVLTFPDIPELSVAVDDLGSVRDSAADALNERIARDLESGVTPLPPSATPQSVGGASLRVPVDPRHAVHLQLRWARQARGLSRADVARRMGISRQRVTKLESPRTNLTLGTIERFCSAIGCQLDIVLRPNDAELRPDGTNG